MKQNPKTKLFFNISELVTFTGTKAKKGKEMSQMLRIKDGAVLSVNGKVEFAGAYKDLDKALISESTQKIDCGNKAVLPGFVDSHTHLVFGGDRADEFMWRQTGVPYMEIMARGGGIANSVEATRAAFQETLFALAQERIKEFSKQGVTTLEAKSGYGLDKETELKQLRVVRKLKKNKYADVVSTFMGAHSVPKEYKQNPDAYIDFIIEEMLPTVKEEKLAEFCDIFCEKGVFTAAQAEKLFVASSRLGIKTKIHADEIVTTGGAELAAKCGCTSADHLLHASEDGIKALAKSKTVATLLPLTAFCLNEPYADARKMIDSGCAVALGSDFNPGSCFSNSIPLLFALSVMKMKMTLEEAVCALTLNGAAAINRAKKVGTLEKGKACDLVILEYEKAEFLVYHTASNCVKHVYKNGRKLF